MENSLIFMHASAERFDSIRVGIKMRYYNGVSRGFYLRDNTMGKLHHCRIEESFYDKGANEQIYQLRVPKLDLSHEYEIENAYGLTCPIDIKGIVNDPEFDQLFVYDKDDLGPTYHPGHTVFKVWAPTSPKVMLEYTLKKETHVVTMKREECGVYSCDVIGDLEGASYVYLVKNNGIILEATDPYAYSCTTNGLRSYVIDLNKIVHDDVKLEPMKQKTDAIIYELSVRDMTSSEYSGVYNRGKFLGLTETGTKTMYGNTSGLDYISELGVTHVQIMPMFDFGSVDELEPNLLYNWGYDPNQYNIPDGSFITEPNNPYKRVQECIYMIEAFHKKGLRVTMDVVFNHVYSVNNHSFERIVPHYYFRNDDFGKFSDGSFCSNDLNTCSLMVRKYIVDMCKRWMTLYHVDGYRFDLMGIIDIYTMNKIERECRAIDPSVMIYGEGWNLPTMLSDKDKAMNDNHVNMPNISFFNDVFRNTMRGENGSNRNDSGGYMCGNGDRTFEAVKLIRNIDKFTYPTQSINYVECHDNETTADKLVLSMSETREVRAKRLTMLQAVCLLSMGIPFIHSGQEFYRTKRGLHNTYNSPDDINQIKWLVRDRYEERIELFRELIRIRKNNPGFRYSTKNEITRYVSVEQVDRSIIVEKIIQKEHENETIYVIYNPANANYTCELEEGLEILFKMPDTNIQIIGNKVILDEVSMAILVKKNEGKEK